jgi:mevalonate kinase
MNPAIGTAPAKIILFGEHAVVYGRPAIAVPVTQVAATVSVTANPRPETGVVHIRAKEINLDSNLIDLPPQHPLAVAVRETMQSIGVEKLPACTIQISSTIPVASGMGSGAAVSAALIRALAAFLDRSLSDEIISKLTFEVEKIHHGTPSGIDNTVIAYGLPVYFVKGEAPQTFHVSQPFNIIIGDTGIASSTAAAVGDVRKAWSTTTERYNALFDAIGEITRSARRAIEEGQIQALGKLMNDNHAVLQELGVSSIGLDNLVQAARQAGALGAKLSGGGRGGNMIALADPAKIDQVAQALRSAGARQTITTTVK